MSNQNSYLEFINRAELFIKQSPNNNIRVKNLDGNKYIKLSTAANPTALNYEDLLKTHNTLITYFDDLVKRESLSRLYFEFKTKAPSGSLIDNQQYTAQQIDVSARLEELKRKGTAVTKPMEEAQMHTPETPTIIPTNTQHSPSAFEANVMQHMGGLGAAGMAAGMGYRELVTMEKKAEMSDYYKTEMERYKKECDVLTIENRATKADLDSAEKSKELAIKEAELKASSWSDPEKMTPILEALSPIAAGFMQKGAAPAQTGLAAASNLSATKNDIIEFISTDSITEDNAKILESVLVEMLQTPNFTANLAALITKSKTVENAPVGS